MRLLNERPPLLQFGIEVWVSTVNIGDLATLSNLVLSLVLVILLVILVLPIVVLILLTRSLFHGIILLRALFVLNPLVLLLYPLLVVEIQRLLLLFVIRGVLALLLRGPALR